MKVEVRYARAEEVPAITKLAVETFPLACPPGLAEADIQRYLETHLSADDFACYVADPECDVLVAASGESLVGYALLFFGADGVPAPALGVTLEPVGLLSKCYVREALHGTGVAQRLMDSAVACGRKRAVAGLWLNVNFANYRAQRFYERCRWQRVGAVDFVVGETTHRDPVYELDLRSEQ